MPEPSPQTRWIDSWAVSYIPNPVNGTLQAVPTFTNQTLRLNVLNKLAGSQLRVQFTNQYSPTPLTIASAHIALRTRGSSIDSATDRPLTVAGQPSITLAPGAQLWSDPVSLDVLQHADLAISLFIPGPFKPTGLHPTGLKPSYLSGPGDFTSAAAFPAAGRRTETLYFVSGVQVLAPARTHVIVAFGDSITDGAASALDSNTSWPDLLSQRLPALPDGTPVSIINMGIGSNRLATSDVAGLAGLKRFDADVLSRSNVTHLIVLEGINDISYEHVTPEQLIAAYQQLITKAHARQIKVIGVTLLPIQNSRKDTPENEATRQAANKWIRTSGAYDGVLDFDKVIQDPQNPLRIRRELTGDFVHPNSAGYRLLADSIDLRLFE